jgi:hypothetical protein
MIEEPIPQLPEVPQQPLSNVSPDKIEIKSKKSKTKQLAAAD